MAKIKVTYFTGLAPYLYIIDDKGRIWQKAATGNSQWRIVDEIPEAPKEDSAEFKVRSA